MSTAKEFQYLASLGYGGSLADKRNAYYQDLINNGGDPDFPTALGEYVPGREFWGGTALITGSGILTLTYFTARRTETVNNIQGSTAATAAGATPTLCRYGVYQIAADGSGALVSSTVNDTALWAAANTDYPKSLSTPFNKVVGQRYAVGALCISAAAMPSFVGTAPSLGTATVQNVFGAAPRLNGRLGGQADLPSNFSDASLSNHHTRIGFRLF